MEAEAEGSEEGILGAGGASQEKPRPADTETRQGVTTSRGWGAGPWNGNPGSRRACAELIGEEIDIISHWPGHTITLQSDRLSQLRSVAGPVKHVGFILSVMTRRESMRWATRSPLRLARAQVHMHRTCAGGWRRARLRNPQGLHPAHGLGRRGRLRGSWFQNTKKKKYMYTGMHVCILYVSVMSSG